MQSKFHERVPSFREATEDSDDKNGGGTNESKGRKGTTQQPTP